MNLKTFIIGGIVVSIPLVILNEVKPEYSYPYVFLILFMLLIFYADKFGGFVNDLRSTIQ